MHPILLRQLKRLGLEEGGTAPTPEQWAKLLERVERTYVEYDQDRYTLERAIEISSREMREVNDNLSKAKEAAETAARAKGDFLAVMSHEIRTPLNGVLGMTGILLGTNLSAEQRECATIVETSAQALLTILDDILHFSKIEAGALVLETIDFELASVVEDVLSLFAEKAQSKGLELAGIVDPTLPRRVAGDPARLRQILSNLVGNAIKFTETGEVVVRVSPAEGGLVRVEVEDTGAGLSSEQIGRLFTPFTQADSSTTRRYGGTGLGLAISKRLVELMGGTIGVTSAVGKGSTFAFTAALPPVADPAGADDLDLRGRRFLVVERHAASRAALASRLSAVGGHVTLAPSPDVVPALVRDAHEAGTPFEVAFVDARWLARGGGPSLTELRALVRVVAVDTWAMHAATTSVTGSAGDFLPKPVSARSLRRVLLPDVDSVRAPLPSGLQESKVRRAPARVLLVEDNLVNQRVARLQLQKLGITEIGVAVNGHEALERLDACTWDVVLMDCQMPGMDGFEATSRWREHERAESKPRTPIVAMTANAMEGDRDRCLEAGMDDYLTKPTTQARLAEVVRRWVPGGLEPSASTPSA